MNNDEIIANEAIYSGFFTESEVERILSEGLDLPFHTYGVWKDHFNMIPKISNNIGGINKKIIKKP